MKVAFLGNCQAEQVGPLLDQATRGAVEARGVNVFRPVAEDDQSWITGADFIFEQGVEKEQSGELLRAATGKVLRMPTLGSRFLWPLRSNGHPQTAETVAPWHPGGLFDGSVVDEPLLDLIRQRGAGPQSPQSLIDDLIEEYLALDYANMIDLDSIIERDRRLSERVGGELGARLWAVVERDFRSQPLFFGFGNLSGRLLQLLCRELAAQIDIPIDHAAAEAAWFELHGGDVPPRYMAPVHPSVLRHFGIGWAGAPARFRWFYDGFLTAGEIAERAIRLVSEDACAVFHHVETTGAAALNELAAALPRYAGSPFFRVRYARLLRMAGQAREAATQYAEALRLLPPQEEFARADIARGLSHSVAEAGALRRPPLVEYDTTVALSAGQAGVSCLAEGWYPPEDWGTWLCEYTGRLRFMLPRPSSGGGGVRLLFRTTAYLGRVGTQAVKIFVNGREAALWWFEHPDPTEKTLEVGAWVHTAEQVDVVFYVTHPTSPVEHGANDTRLLGLALTAMTVRPL